ncbi:MAG: aminoglycoside phosphotransferase family protein [Acidimicrobiia bacterium]
MGDADDVDAPILAEVALVQSLVGAEREITFDGEGWDSRVYLVDAGAAVFKFPRSEPIRVAYRQEVAVLQLVESMGLPLWTPRVRWVGPDLAYFGYEGMRGTAADLSHASQAGRAAIGSAIGHFARELHTLDVPGVRIVDVECEVRDFQRQWGDAGHVTAERFSRAERSRLDAFYAETMPAEMRRLGGELVLCHGDLGPWNILVDAGDIDAGDVEAGNIDAGTGVIGVIDFGDVCRCDRSKDLIGMYEPDALDAALDAYRYLGDASTLRDRIAVRARALPAMDLVFFAGKHDDFRLDQCIQRIRDLHA